MGTNHIVMGKGHSYLLFTGPGRIYWFLFVKNAQVTYGKSVPRYSAQDEQRLAEEHFEDRLNEHDTFADIYKNRIISRLTPLHEYQWKRWHFGRIITIGDAAHKVAVLLSRLSFLLFLLTDLISLVQLHPINGSGGGAAVEDAAVLVDALLDKLQQTKHKRLSTQDFHDAFFKAQSMQERRTQTLLDRGTMMQKMDAMDTAVSPLLVRFVIPNLTDDAALSVIGSNTVPGQRIKALAMPKRDRYVPFDDELPARPLKSATIGNAIFAVAHLFLLFLAYEPVATFEHGFNIFDDADISHYSTKTHDLSDKERLQLPTLIRLILPIALIWTLEGHRHGNKGSPWSW